MTADLDVVAIVPAAGNSQRMGGSKPKVLIELGGESVLKRTVRALASCPAIRCIIIAARASDFETLRAETCECTQVVFVEGGETRQHSVSNALDHIVKGGLITDRGLVLVHDAARCLVAPSLVADCIREARLSGAVTAAIPIVDSIKRVGADLEVEGSLDRAGLWAVQTPQVFRRDLIVKAHEGADRSATDDACLVEKFHKVRVVPGARSNFKITTPDDLELAAALLSCKVSL
jgi:2-C-methyl-D-erythritol 4-phosphate cytidylyltransferase